MSHRDRFKLSKRPVVPNYGGDIATQIKRIGIRLLADIYNAAQERFASRSFTRGAFSSLLRDKFQLEGEDANGVVRAFVEEGYLK